jgi:hypothetical protein
MRGVMLYRMIKFLSRAELEGKLSVSDWRFHPRIARFQPGDADVNGWSSEKWTVEASQWGGSRIMFTSLPMWNQSAQNWAGVDYFGSMHMTDFNPLIMMISDEKWSDE